MRECIFEEISLPMEMYFQKTIIALFICITFFKLNAQELPTQKYNQFEYSYIVDYTKDTLSIKLENPLHCPLRINLFSKYLKENKLIKDTLKILLNERSKREIKFFIPNLDVKKFNYSYFQALGDENKIIKKNILALPFPKGKKFKIMQGNNGSFTHNTPYSRYAVDFDMKVGDTITSADDGFVVGVIKDYEFGKNDKNWENFSNFITVYHPQSGLFTQYAHLKKNGNFVKVGDFVKRNQPIGLSGETGYVSGAHLHFNVLIPERNKTLVSVPYYFENGIYSENIYKNQKVKNRK